MKRMRTNEKQAGVQANEHMIGANFHRFMELEGNTHSLEIAQELGLSLGDVKKLKRKLNRS
ncbi:hypothetical protein [Radiobacillus sp. PE A8.2]|uniref:hypothetical protein n=1 Tax=Radiobacillus sp. PE A8.2 TaxID=3380349 RepID=UPI003890BE6C